MSPFVAASICVLPCRKAAILLRSVFTCCVCEREREREREGGREKERESERERKGVCVCIYECTHTM